jgi:long-subunit fatty acid transport protein
MPPRPSARFVPLPARAAGGAVSLALLVALAAPAAAQTGSPKETDRIDITGRQNLTLGSGARAYGMGGAFLARADDATAASWNPAGLSYLRVPEVSFVGAFNSFVAARGLDSDSFKGQAIDFGAFTWPVGFGEVRGAVQLSYQRAISFDGARTIRLYNRTSGLLEVFEDGRSSGGFDVLAFGTGVRLTRRVRAGFTVNRWLKGYDQTLSRTVLTDTRRPLRDFDLDFRPRGWSFNIGLIVSPIEQLNLAAVFKTPFTANVRLDKARRDSWGTVGSIEEVTSNAHASDAVRLEFPSSFGFGISWRPRDTVTLSADYTRTRWSETRIDGYFDLDVTGRSDEGVSSAPPAPTVYGPLQYPSLRAVPDPSDPEDPARLLGQQDAEQIRAGIEWVLIKGRLKVPLRAGYFNDRQIIPISGGDPPRFNGITVGTGIILGSLLVDVAYVYEFGEYYLASEAAGGADFDVPPTTPQPPIRNSLTTNRFFASVIYRFSGRWGP